MPGKRLYSDKVRGQVYMSLQASGGNVTKAVRDTGVPASTIRQWRTDWERNGGLTDKEIISFHRERERYVEDAARVRDKALRRLEEIIPEAKSVRELATVFGILDDKIRIARGLKPGRVDAEEKQANAKAAQEQLANVITGALDLAATRREEIVEAEVVEEPAEKPALRIASE